MSAGEVRKGEPERLGGGQPPEAAQPRRDHWHDVHSKKAADEVSWYQAEPALSLDLIRRSAAAPARVLDVGAGTSRLVDRLLELGYRPGALDITTEPLRRVRQRLGAAAEGVEWFVADMTRFVSPHGWDVWHDRAAFHFLTDAADRSAYRDVLLRSTAPGASVIIATFGPEGPDRCSGLPTVRYSPEQLQAELGAGVVLAGTEWEQHRTPAGGRQQFIYCRFVRT
jgi:SAM-dependent methyltransferase